MDINENFNLVVTGGTILVSVVTQIIVYRVNSALTTKRLTDMEEKNRENEESIKTLRLQVESFNQLTSNRMHAFELGLATLESKLTEGLRRIDENQKETTARLDKIIEKLFYK